MTDTEPKPADRLVATVSELAAAYVTHNHVAASDLPALIASIHAALTGLVAQGRTSATASKPNQKYSPAEIRKSITPEALISFIDGKSYKMLKRHITKHGFTPDSYRVRFGLPPDYPVTAPSYSSRRSALAKEHQFGIVAGLGAKHRTK